jgi:gentisate 1,2-dioxygenase
MEKFKELERWEQLQSRAINRGMVTSVDRHKIKMTPGILKVLESSKRHEIHFLSLEEAESWLDGYDWMLEHATNLGWDLKAAERTAYELWDQQRILRTLSSD